MATVVVSAAMNGDAGRSVHPFFKPVDIPDQPLLQTLGNAENEEIVLTDIGSEQDPTQSASTKARKTKKSNGAAQHPSGGKTQKTLQDILNPKVRVSLPQEEGVQNGAGATDVESSEPLVDSPRRKRRKTSQGESVEVGDMTEPLVCLESGRQTSPQVAIAASPALPESRSQVIADQPATPPKKMLRLSANGKFSSPISKKEPKHNLGKSPEPPKRRGRPRKAKANDAPKQLLVRLRYRDDIAQRVERILRGEERLVIEKKMSPKKTRTPRKPAKSTHPFFLEKSKEPPQAPKHDSPRKTTATTPGKLKNQVFGDRLRTVDEGVHVIESALLKDRLVMRQPGAREAPWPDREQAHVRGLNMDRPEGFSRRISMLGKPKWKNARLPFRPEESLLSHYASKLVSEAPTRVRADGYNEPHESLRLPNKLLISGHDLQQRLKTSLSTFNTDVTPHPAVFKRWQDLPGTLSAFDEDVGETLSWVEKYAPGTAEEVLQPEAKMKVLKDWLKSLTITAVETTTKAEGKPGLKAELKPRKKRRRKPADLDGFLVDSDEDIHNMDELSEPQDNPLDAVEKTQRSVVQIATAETKLSNGVLLSGPCGCGKTAAAHAVAKELGFRVFDISPCERRTGKDVLDKIGDMTENHLVKHHGIDPADLSSTEEPNRARVEEAFQRDLESGRQGKMLSFFQPQAKPLKPSTKSKATNKINTIAAIEKAIKKPAKDQQQSLIILEEVDVLFKEDRDFWSTVLRLIVTSKRPFIMTCNDEDLVPLQAMHLHAILRFAPPAPDLATDYILLIAACEGHLLQRRGVFSLYQAKHCDLRSSIAELNFWCQMGVGDPKSGLSWIYQRWPPGSDLDSAGRILRTVSEGTYQAEIGAPPNASIGEEEDRLSAWKDTTITPMESLGCGHVAKLVQARETDDRYEPKRRLHSLRQLERLTDSLSAIDVFVRPGLPETAPLQTTQPPIRDKVRGHYIEGLPLLQGDEQIDYQDMSARLAVSCTLAAQHAYGGDKTSSLCEVLAEVVHDSHEQARMVLFRQPMKRNNFAVFDAISTPCEPALSATGPTGLLQSAFDGPLSIITTDLAPYVRMIVQYDIGLEEQRERLSEVISDGRAPKKARTTRAARSALEGSQRSNTRRERWFTKALDLPAVLATGGADWPKTEVFAHAGYADSDAPSSSAETL